MVNRLPAVLIGGPPHAGKSVLFYRLTQALRARNIPHHALRACPDGEGNWFHEGDPTLVNNIRSKLPEWPDEFVQRIRHDLEHRCLPLLVDMGGNPKASQECLLHHCTNAILLLRSDLPAATRNWERLMAENNLLPLASIFSEREGSSHILEHSPILKGTITALERHTTRTGPDPLFDAVVERIATLFRSYGSDDLRQILMDQAPTELAIDLETTLHQFTTASTQWETTMVPSLLASLPEQVPLSIYGAGPGWLYAILAAFADPQPFYLFDPKIDWVQPARATLGNEPSSQMHIEKQSTQDRTILTLKFPQDRLEYFQLDPLQFPPVSTEKGLVINGRVPNWLLTALVRLYKACGVPWIAPFYIRSNCPIIAYSCVSQYQPGDHV